MYGIISEIEMILGGDNKRTTFSRSSISLSMSIEMVKSIEENGECKVMLGDNEKNKYPNSVRLPLYNIYSFISVAKKKSDENWKKTDGPYSISVDDFRSEHVVSDCVWVWV